ncbi:DNA adenine methylase [Swaminathania salitolerans]|uniref:DNA methyltransferase n=1 Tax=Swaminathania salitolerans TaxID=182838 RepID=A0A511BNM4_9PROT|nr:DNA adenine methylase [Swaminathania salitolerans]GBQ14687.1 site-specific DNA methylase [Swaminathania salitolerans LMG 21291]GEL01855.1 DNA methyltransferase [Swaminathania salitolerans]
MESNFRPTPAVKPVAPYLGGKSRLAARIIQRIRAVPHETYVEPFIGMGGVFFRRPFTVKCEVINDLNRDVSNLFRILQHHYVPLMDMLRWQLTSRDQFEWLLAAVPESLTDLHRAARFLYILKTAFGGKIRRPGFGVSLGPARFDVQSLGTTLEEVHRRLSRVVIECLPYHDILSRYDRPGTLFYLDPPYWGCERDYGAPFARTDLENLARILSKIEGRFILSLNDRPEVREMFAAFGIEAVETSYSIAGTAKGRGRVGEVLISNG